MEYWGHIHTRVNEYEAVLTVRATSEAWEITAYEVLNERHVRFETGLRLRSATARLQLPCPADADRWGWQLTISVGALASEDYGPLDAWIIWHAAAIVHTAYIFV